jgi:ribosomal protein S18 acetylase RimI-like enzyme
MIELMHARSKRDLPTVRKLFREYAALLGFSLQFQDFEEELAGLPGDYAPPHGEIVLAYYGGRIAGCAALRRIDGGTCEMKRLYVRSRYRGKGIGRRLAETIVDDARALGFRSMKLDTVYSMVEAIHLYRSMGFTETAPYRYNPLSGVIYFELELL